MEMAHTDAIKKSVRTYVLVFVALMVLTVITVAISTLHLNGGAAVTFALIVAAIKGSLVAGFFMHLISERKLVYATLILTAIFFVALMFLPVSTYLNRVAQ